MSAEFSGVAAQEPPERGAARVVHAGENFLLALPFAALVALPLIAMALRRFHGGIPGSSAFVQHCTLLIGMLGGAVAARDGRLLSFSTVSGALKGRLKSVAQIISGAAAAAVSTLLCVAAVQFVLSERSAGSTIVSGLPSWWVELVLPAGFGLIALRLLRHAADTRRGKVLAGALAAAIVLAGAYSPVAPDKLVWPAMILLLACVFLGAPVFTAIGGAALILFWSDASPIAAIVLKHYSLTTNPTLPTIPLFTLAGFFLAAGGASRRLVDVFLALFGSVRGGPAIVTALVCAFFTSFTGASGVTILALGGMLMPVLKAARYTDRDAMGLVPGAGPLGLLFPPCLPVILYSIVASTAMANLGSASMANAGSVSMEKMFLGGLLPGILMVVLTAWWGVRRQPPDLGERTRFDAAAARRAVWAAKWELLLPVVALAALFAGFATPVEAAALTAAYALLVTTVIHRDLRPLRDVLPVAVECGRLVGGVLLILGVALGFTHYLVEAQVPDSLVSWASHAIQSKWILLLGMNVVLIFVGGLIEIYAAIVVVVPLLVPLGIAFGIDPVQLGVIFLANMELGFLAPPVGLNLLLASARFDRPLIEVMRAALPMLGVLFLGVLLVTYVPPLTTWLPQLVK